MKHKILTISICSIIMLFFVGWLQLELLVYIIIGVWGVLCINEWIYREKKNNE